MPHHTPVILNSFHSLKLFMLQGIAHTNLNAWNTVFPSADTPLPFPSGLRSSPPYRQTFPDLGKLDCAKWQPGFHFLILYFYIL